MGEKLEKQDGVHREVSGALAELLERRGTSQLEEGNDSVAGTPKVEIEKSVGWLPPIVSLSSDDVEMLVTEMLRLNADVVAAIAAEGIGASQPGMAFMRVDVASRVTRWASVLLDRSRKMGSLSTGEVPVVRDATSTAINKLK